MAEQKIEEELAHLRRTTEELSEIVARQADEIDLLNRRVQMLLMRAAEQESEGTGGVVLADERPPHY
ncbi:SlyX family protein [Aliiruegeria lutimaris]|uniref:SlyX protein n=1 Tax=Aliiruegeria lutimaris TaxID=571298 RepID=A0A1G9H3C0_9RHOB|nr:SlyX family protein [Aliiruegeria lutimaris]SDL07448.1 SlyX protein [Aliiruegeria lutimaris]